MCWSVFVFFFKCLLFMPKVRHPHAITKEPIPQNPMKVFSKSSLGFTSELKLSPVSSFCVSCFVLFCFVLVQPNDSHLPDSYSVVLGPSWNWLFRVVMLGPLCL